VDLSRFLDLFVAESREHLAAADELVTGISTHPGDAEALKELFRHIHSLKGMAASMGYPALASLAHVAEDLMDDVRSGTVVATTEIASLLLDTLACMESMVEAAERGAPVQHARAPELEGRLQAARFVRPAEDPPQLVDVGKRDETPSASGASARLPAFRIDLVLAAGDAPAAVLAAQVLSRLAKLGEVVRSDPPMAALRAGKFDGKLGAVVRTALAPKLLATEVARIDDIETFQIVPALEPRQAAAPARAPAAWLRVRVDLLDALVEETLELMLHQGRLTAAIERGMVEESRRRSARCQLHVRKLYAELMELRLVPFETVAHRILRGVRELTRSLGKQVRFEIAGQDVRLDRTLLDGLVDPLLHLVRNAIDHGIESPDHRTASGKPREGSVRLTVERGRDEVQIAVCDDGRGLRPQELRDAAVARGLLSPAEVARLTDLEALLLTTLPGFSTAPRGGQVSGRGVGMDVVRSSVESFGGRLLLDSQPGRGTRVVLALPLTASVVQALLIRSSGELYAVPVAYLDRADRIAEASIHRKDGKASLETVEGSIDVFYLEERLGIDAAPASHPERSALIYPARGRTVALVVDEVLGRKEILVKPLRPPLDVLRAYEGAALLQDGSLALVLDPVSLVSI
jgi:two-component system chemotaxis sensor kinase CheA